MSDFLDELALQSNAQSTLRDQNGSLIMKLTHPTLPHAASLCLESRELLVVGRANGQISIAYFLPISEQLHLRLARERSLVFENVGYVAKTNPDAKAYAQIRQIPVSIYSSAAKLRPLSGHSHRANGRKLFNIVLARGSAKIPLPNSSKGHIPLDYPPIMGEILIEHDAKLTDFRSFDQGIEIAGERYELRLIDRALLAALSFIEW